MCDPITIAGAALSAGSIAANSAAQSQVTKARNSALEAERQRQQELDRENAVLLEGNRNRYQDFEGQQGQKAQQLGDYFAAAKIAPVEGAPSAVPASSSNITVREQEKQKGKADAFGEQQSEALGNLRAFGDLLGGISREQARDTAKIGQVNNFKKGSAEALKYELEAANDKGKGMKLFGDLLGLAGSVGISKGLGGSFNPGSITSTPAGALTKAASSAIAPFFTRPGTPSATAFTLY